MIFWAVFCAFGFKVWKKYLYCMTFNKFFLEKIEEGVKKRRISRWFWIRWKSCEKMHQKKVIRKTSLTNRSKSEKVHFSVTFLLITFFRAFFQNCFNRFEISVKFWVFWHLFRLKKKNILRSYLYFFQTLIANSQETAQKTENHFYECILEFNYATIKGFA